MDKHYLFSFSRPLTFEEVLYAFQEARFPTDTLKGEGNHYSLCLNVAYDVELPLTLMNVSYALGCHLGVLSAHEESFFMWRLAEEARSYFPDRLIFPFDMIMKEMSLGNYLSYQDLIRLVEKASEDSLMLVGAYLRSGCDGVATARTLYIHRNTFNYRLNIFIQQTGIDVRDYHNALLVELYFQLKASRGS